MCVFINCILESLHDHNYRHTFWNLVSEYLGIFLLVLQFYLAMNVLFKDYLRCKPSYRLLGMLLLFQSTYHNDLWMQDYQGVYMQANYTHIYHVFNFENLKKVSKFKILYKIMWIQESLSKASRNFVVICYQGL